MHAADVSKNRTIFAKHPDQQKQKQKQKHTQTHTNTHAHTNLVPLLPIKTDAALVMPSPFAVLAPIIHTHVPPLATNLIVSVPQMQVSRDCRKTVHVLPRAGAGACAGARPASVCRLPPDANDADAAGDGGRRGFAPAPILTRTADVVDVDVDRAWSCSSSWGLGGGSSPGFLLRWYCCCGRGAWP